MNVAKMAPSNTREVTGGEAIAETLVAGGVETCFANPGTSEMHFVSALDRVDGIRCVLGLFEGVVTGAADGYGRMRGKPAATLLHLGPGLGNGIANLHNAKRAHTPIVNIVGDHATYHNQYDAPMTSDIMGAARPFSDWVHRSASVESAADDTAKTIDAARSAPGGVATLILPADVTWMRTQSRLVTFNRGSASGPSEDAVKQVTTLLQSGKRVGIILGGSGLIGKGLEVAGKIAARTSVRLLSTNGVSRIERGAGYVSVEPIPYPVDLALAFLGEFDHLILAGGERPVAFFAYPGKPSLMAPKNCTIDALTTPEQDVVRGLEALADAVGAGQARAIRTPLDVPDLATGAISANTLGQSIAALLPERAIVSDESVSTGVGIFMATRRARPHDFMKNVGGSIGFGLPAATGAAIACPDRKVVCLQADGSAMYTIQALWTQAREGLNISNVIFNNRTYAILHGELRAVGANSGPKARDMLDIDRPTIDFCGLARAMGVPAERATDMDSFNRLFARSLAAEGPSLVEVML